MKKQMNYLIAWILGLISGAIISVLAYEMHINPVKKQTTGNTPKTTSVETPKISKGNVISNQVFGSAIVGIDTSEFPYKSNGKIYIYDTLIFPDGTKIYSASQFINK